MIQTVQVAAADLKGRDPSGRILDPDAVQAAAFAQKKCADKNIRGLVRPGDRSSPPLLRHD